MVSISMPGVGLWHCIFLFEVQYRLLTRPQQRSTAVDKLYDPNLRLTLVSNVRTNKTNLAPQSNQLLEKNLFIKTT